MCPSRSDVGQGPISLEMTCSPHISLSAKDALPQWVCSYSDVILCGLFDLGYSTQSRDDCVENKPQSVEPKTWYDYIRYVTTSQG